MLVVATEKLAVTAVTMIQEYEKRNESNEYDDGEQNGPLCACRHEAHKIARIGFEEVQIAGKNRLISDGYFEMFDHRDNECHRQKYWRGDPEAVDEHEQYHIQHAPQNQVEHRHKVEVGEHFGDEAPTGQPHVVRKLDACSGLTDANL